MTLKYNSIIVKTFIFTIILFISLLFLNLVAQEIFLSRYYKLTKIDITKERINDLVKNLAKDKYTPDDVQVKLSIFSGENQLSTGIVNGNGYDVFGDISLFNYPYITISTANNKLYYISVKNADKKTIGQNVEVNGPIYEYGDNLNYIVPYSISYNNKQDPTVNGSGTDTGETITVKGTLIDVNNNNRHKKYVSNYTAYNVEYINNVLNRLKENKTLNKEILSNTINYEELTDQKSGLKYLVFRTPITINNDRYLLLASMSIHPVDDTILILKIYSKYVFLFAILVAIIVVYFYSLKLSRPLIELRNVASRMAKLDFSAKYRVKSDDELGELGMSLNTLSHNLKNNINELKQANIKLSQDIDKERELEIVRKQLIADLSHELKTPLTIIEGISSGIRDDVYDNNDKSYINSIIDEVTQMNSIIYEMLELSKIESGKYNLDIVVFDLANTVLKVHNKLKILAANKDIKVNIFIEETFVYGDMKKIEQVIMNLYTNAINYTDTNQSITISFEHLESNESVMFTIENTGVHIDDNDVKNIWKPFYRVEKSRSRKSGGTGLGLNIVQGILSHHKSKFGVTNTKRGVLFYFTLKKNTNKDF